MAATLYWINDLPAGRLAILPRPRGGDWLDDEVRSWHAAGVDVVVSLLTRDEVHELALADEETLCGRYGIEFLSFPIPDRGTPRVRAPFETMVRELQLRLNRNLSVAIHCRAGIGRASLLAAGILVPYLGMDADAAFEQVEAARGCPVPDTAEQRAWIETFARSIRTVTPAL